MPVRNYRTLHGIRGVAALCIVALHSPRLFGPMPGFLGLAVDLFFALSGFVLAHAYEDRFRQGMTPLAFLRQRWVRLYPLYAVGLLLGIAHQAMGILYDSPTVSWTWRELLTALPFAVFMLPAPLSHAFPFNGSCPYCSWSRLSCCWGRGASHDPARDASTNHWARRPTACTCCTARWQPFSTRSSCRSPDSSWNPSPHGADSSSWRCWWQGALS
jgi:hypothetical protein